MYKFQVAPEIMPKVATLDDVDKLARQKSGWQGRAVFWIWMQRKIGTWRPSTPGDVMLEMGSTLQSLCEARGGRALVPMECARTGFSMLRVFMEEVDDLAWPFVSCGLGILLFLKYLDLPAGVLKVRTTCYLQ